MTHCGTLRVHLFVERTRALGPFERAALWLQGCNRRCKGCMSPATRPLSGGAVVETEQVLRRILAIKGVEGVTISGGEPFLQAEELAHLCGALQNAGLGAIVYTGFTLEELQAQNDPAVDAALSSIDLLIDGPFEQALAENALALRGSSNQRVLPLTQRYVPVLEEVYGTARHRVELQMVDGKLAAVGVPTPSMLRKMEQF